MSTKQTETTVVDTREDLPALVAAQAVEIAALRLALVRLRNLGDAAKMVPGSTVAGIARDALEARKP